MEELSEKVKALERQVEELTVKVNWITEFQQRPRLTGFLDELWRRLSVAWHVLTKGAA